VESLKYLVRVVRQVFVGDSTNYSCRSVADDAGWEGSWVGRGLIEMWKQGSLEWDRYGSGWCEEEKGQAKPGEPLYMPLRQLRTSL
jgi:hypothetical protein